MTSAFVNAVVVPWLNAFALALLPIIGGYAVALLRKRGLDNQFFQAVERAGGVAYAALLASGKPLTDKAAVLASAQAGAAYLQDRVPGLVAARSLSPEAAAQIAGAELGKLLAADPSVAPGAAQ